MATPDTPAVVSRPRSRGRHILLAAGGCGLVFAAVIFFGLGRWLVVEDPLMKARAIVVLSGAMPVRAIEAANLYREGYAPEIWLTHSTEPAETLQEMGIPFAGEDHYNRLVLIHEGVPADAIHVLEPPIVNTADEIKVVAAALSRGKGVAVLWSRRRYIRAVFACSGAGSFRARAAPSCVPRPEILSIPGTGGAPPAMRSTWFAKLWVC